MLATENKSNVKSRVLRASITSLVLCMGAAVIYASYQYFYVKPGLDEDPGKPFSSYLPYYLAVAVFASIFMTIPVLLLPRALRRIKKKYADFTRLSINQKLLHIASYIAGGIIGFILGGCAFWAFWSVLDMTGVAIDGGTLLLFFSPWFLIVGSIVAIFVVHKFWKHRSSKE